MWVFKERLKKIGVWKNLAELYNGKYKLIKTFTKKEAVYRSDYIEPYDYKSTEYVEFKNIDTGTRFTMTKSLALWMFEEK